MDMAKSIRLVTAFALIVLLTASGIHYDAKADGPRSVQLNAPTHKIILKSDSIDVRFADSVKGEQKIPVEQGYYLVHFTENPDEKTAQRFIQAVSQGNILQIIPHNTYLCRLTSSTWEAVNALKKVDWIGLWKSEYKISPSVYEDSEITASSEAMALDGESNPKFNKLPQPENEYIIIFFKGENITDYLDHIKSLGGTVHSYTFDRMLVHIDQSILHQIADMKGVYWIERKYLMAPVNDNGTWIVQTNQLANRKMFSNGLSGSGQVVGVSDTGIDADHLMFWDSTQGLPSHTYNGSQRKILSYYNWYQTGNLITPAPPDSPYYDPGDGYFPGAADPMYNVYDWDMVMQDHGTHTSGTVAGEWELGTPLPTWGGLGVTPTAGYDFYEGNAYGARLVFQDLTRTDSPYLYPPPDLNDPTPSGTLNGVSFPGTVGLFPQAMGDGAYIHTNSWGGGNFGEYSQYSQDIDEMMWTNQDFLVIFSNGNDGPGTTTITPPATAKNCLSIGATETTNDGYGHNAVNVADFSSWGPTGGWGRVKPDVCAPGYYIFSAGNNDVTDGTSPNDELYGFGGTSMAAPTVAGCCALVREYFTTGMYNPVGASTGFMGAGAFTPTAAQMKSVIINSAEPMTGNHTGGTLPGDGQGWGRVNLDNSLYFSGDTRSTLVDDNTTGLDGAAIVQPFFKAYTVTVGPGEVLDVSMAYSDPPGTAGSAFQMVNYMYVEVDHPNGIDYYLSGAGNYSGGQSILNPGFIYPDTVQKVRINNPDPGVYTIFAVAFQTDQVTPGWNVQPYALTVSGNLVQSQGYVQFDQDYYGTAGPLTMTLTDGDIAGIGTAPVTVSSASTGDSETATLTEIGGSGIFQGTFPCAPGSATPGNGTLEVSDPDTLTVTYNDASPVGVRTDTAQIDGIPPVFSNVLANTCNGSSVEITWDTDENATSTVHWGETTAYGNTVSDSTLVTNHFIEFDGLAMGQTYYYEVCSTDQAGNAACSGPYSFTTPLIYTPARYHAGYVAEFTYGLVLDDDDMWTGHNVTYAGIRHGIFQYNLSSLPCEARIKSVEIILFKQDDQFEDMQTNTWSCNLIDFKKDLYMYGNYNDLHNAPTLLTLSPTWTTAQLDSDAPGTMYSLTLASPGEIAYFNPGGHRANLLTFRLDGATTGDDIMSWDTGFRQDIGSLGVCYKPQLKITYDLTGICPNKRSTSLTQKAVNLCPLANTNILVAQNLQNEAQQLLSQIQGQGGDTTPIEELLSQADEFLEKAMEFCQEGTNCIAGNWNALKAIQLYNQAMNELETLLSP
jgi:hypothetical protein